MNYNPHDVTRIFEAALCDYCGSKFAVACDNESNALFLCLMYENVKGLEISVPARTYMSVPLEIIHAGGKVKFGVPNPEGTLSGWYYLYPTRIIDSALFFSADMYIPGTLMCLSFTGSFKTLKLGKGGAILTDDEKAYRWLKRARFSGRQEMSYHDDDFDFEGGVAGWNFYMNPMIATLGLQMMPQFYWMDGSKKKNAPVTLPYPDLSKFEIYSRSNVNS